MQQLCSTELVFEVFLFRQCIQCCDTVHLLLLAMPFKQYVNCDYAEA